MACCATLTMIFPQLVAFLSFLHFPAYFLICICTDPSFSSYFSYSLAYFLDSTITEFPHLILSLELSTVTEKCTSVMGVDIPTS